MKQYLYPQNLKCHCKPVAVELEGLCHIGRLRPFVRGDSGTAPLFCPGGRNDVLRLFNDPHG